MFPSRFFAALFLFANPTKIPKRPFHTSCKKAAIHKIPASIGKQPNLYNKYVPLRRYYSSSNVALYLNKDSKFTGGWPYVLFPLSWGIWTASAESNEKEASTLDPTIKKRFFNAIRNGKRKTVISFLEADPNLVNARDKEENTPFLCASQKGQLAIAKLLRQRGANINATDKFDNNALHLACSAGHVDMVTWLLENCNIDLEAKKSVLKMTVFLYAAENGQLKIAELLKEHDANIHETDAFGNNALHLACSAGHVDMAKWLLENCNIDLEAKGSSEKTAFLQAAENRGREILEWLIKHGANKRATDKNGDNALQLARRNPNKGVTDYLKSLGLPEQHTREYKDPVWVPPLYEFRQPSSLSIE